MPKTVYIFEDEPTLATLLKAKLKSAGYLTEHAWDGEAGWNMLKAQKPDLLLLDVRMPKMSGVDVLRNIRADEGLRELPVIVVSNSATEAEAEELKKLGVQDYLIKVEFEPGELLGKIDKFFGKSGGGEAAAAHLKKVLIVEDDPDLRELVALKLTSAGFNVIKAVEGEAGLQLVEKEKPGVVILDLVLPGMSGLEMLKRLREKEDTKNLPVIVLSNFAEREHMEMVKPYGVVDYLAKTSFFPEDIVAKINQMAGEK